MREDFFCLFIKVTENCVICFSLTLSIIFLDVNECETGQQECSEFAQCVNTIGSHSCFCLSGFTGDGKNCSGTYHYLIMHNFYPIVCLIP